LIVVRSKTLRLVLALLAAAGVVATLAVLAVAAPAVSHRGAAAATYCFPSDKQDRKAALDSANAAVASAQSLIRTRGAAVTAAKTALKNLVKAQARAKAAYFKKYKGPHKRQLFLKAQRNALAAAEKKIANAQKALAAAQRALAVARQAQVNAQGAFDQCS
jgi:hypothetical protein